MIGIRSAASLAPSLRGVFRSWLPNHLRGNVLLTEALPTGTVVPNLLGNGSVRVLVVDDIPVNRSLISALLESRGLVPVLAANGAEAVTLACELHFDLILMDLQMPVLDGLKATAAIRRWETQRSLPAVPIVSYTSNSPGPSVLAAHGFTGTLAKPCANQQLEACLVLWCTTYRSPTSPSETEVVS